MPVVEFAILFGRPTLSLQRKTRIPDLAFALPALDQGEARFPVDNAEGLQSMPSPSRENGRERLTMAPEHYSSVLCELWSNYTKFLHVGMAAAGFTVVAVGQYLNTFAGPFGDLAMIIKAAILFAGLAGISFALCRWLSQVIMERQVYGPRVSAEQYFVESETRSPNALRYSAKTLKYFYFANDVFKFVGAVSLIVSWGSIVFVMFHQVDIVGAVVEFDHSVQTPADAHNNRQVP
jgi:hypothetical protein